jgi:hypothetical protein
VAFRIGTDDPKLIPKDRAGGRVVSVTLASGVLSKRPQDVPVIWLGGPLHMILEAEGTTLVPGKRLEMYVSVGTFLSKESGRKLLYWEAPEGLHPTVEIEFPRKGGGPPIKSTFTLKERCCGSQFHGPVLVPAEAGEGKARIEMSFAEWKEGLVAPRSGWLPVAEQMPAAKEEK